VDPLLENYVLTNLEKLDDLDTDERVEQTSLMESVFSTLSRFSPGVNTQGQALIQSGEEINKTPAGPEYGKAIASGTIKGVESGLNAFKDLTSVVGSVLDPIGNAMLQQKYQELYGMSFDNVDVVDMIMPVLGLTSNDFDNALKSVEPGTELGQVGRDLTMYIVAASITPAKGSNLVKGLMKGTGADMSVTPEIGNIATLAQELGVENEWVAFLNAKLEDPDDVSAFERLKAGLKGVATDTIGAGGVIYASFLAAAKILASTLGKATIAGGFGAAATQEEADAAGIKPLIKAGLDYLGFFSKAQDEALKLTQEKGMGEQFKNMLINAGVKKDEIEWTGLDEVLKKDNVTKQEIVEHLDLNKIEIREHVRDRDESELYLNWNTDDIRLDDLAIDKGVIPDKLKATMTPEEAFGPEYIANRADELKDDTDPRPKGSTLEQEALNEYYSDPIRILEDSNTGLVLTGNDSIGWLFFASRADATNNKNAINEDDYVFNLNEAKIQVQQHAMENDLIAPDYEATLFKGYTIPGGENYREFTLSLSDENRSPALENAVFQSDHFPEEDIIAHIRTTDRKAVDGGKILYVEEIQSDWAQTGRKSGFSKSEEELKEISAKRKEAQALLDKYKEKVEKTGEDLKGKELDEANMAANYLRETAQFITQNDGKPQKAPFVTSTSQWTDLTIKRLLAIANEEGYDYISFSPGHIQKDRYGAEGNVKFYDEIIPARIKKIINKMDKNAIGSLPITDSIGRLPKVILKDKVSFTIILTPKLKEAVSKGQSLFTPAVATAGGASLALSGKETRQ
tara:strand:- start:3561 stop:5954 length:2394 start_codon:yes stop_codon:yes gene_type:complete